MIIITTGGAYVIRQATEAKGLVTIQCVDRESAQLVVDGLALIDQGEDRPIGHTDGALYPFYVTVDRDLFAEWVAFETREYLSYQDFAEAAGDSRGPEWFWLATEVLSDLQEVKDD